MPKSESKTKVVNKLAEYLDKYATIMICEVKDLPADYIHSIRKGLRAIKTEVLCGKTTVIGKGINMYLENNKLPKFHNKEKLLEMADKICGMHLFMIFTNEDISKVTEVTNKWIVEKQARPGAISPIEVVLKAGSTGMDSSQIDYFQALKIQTKVIKNQLEIITDSKILTVGQKITISEINLMKKFNIKPYKHMVQCRHIYMSGSLYGAEILKINDKFLEGRLEAAIKNVACFSLASGIPNKASVSHSIANAFQNIMGLSNISGVPLKQVDTTAKAAVVAPVEEKKVEKKAEKKKPEPEPEEEDDGGMMDMFG